MITANTNILVRSADCSEEGSFNKFSLISGKFDENGKIDGKAILKLNDDEKDGKVKKFEITRFELLSLTK